MIELIGLHKHYSNGVALEPTTLTIRSGEYFVLCGPSGAGKSTLLRLLAGLEQPTGGTLRLAGQDVQHQPPHQRQLTWVPQRATLYPHRDIAGNIRLGLELQQANRPRAERLSIAEMNQRVNEAADQLGIAALLKHRADQVSGGEAKRVMLARALVRKTPLWLLDEPLGQVDSARSDKLSQDLHLLQRLLGITIVHVTHDPIEAMALADRVGLLGGGRLLQVGKPLEVYARPSSRTVGLHFGRPPINLIDGTATDDWFVSNDQRWQVPNPPQAGPLTLGVRVEDVSLTEQPAWLTVGVGNVQTVQRLGHGSWVSVGESIPLRAWYDGVPLAVHTPTAVHVRPTALHWFDATGQRIELGSSLSSTTS